MLMSQAQEEVDWKSCGFLLCLDVDGNPSVTWVQKCRFLGTQMGWRLSATCPMRMLISTKQISLRRRILLTFTLFPCLISLTESTGCFRAVPALFQWLSHLWYANLCSFHGVGGQQILLFAYHVLLEAQSFLWAYCVILGQTSAGDPGASVSP